MKSDRLFAITYMLIDKKTVTARELSEKFGVSARTIYRDIDALSLCGVPIYTEKGRNGGISIMEHYAVSNALLNDEEQLQVVSALQSVGATGQLEVSDALVKLKGIFKRDFPDWIEIDFMSWEQGGKENKVFLTIKNSILHSTLLSFDYFSNKGEKSNRIVEPTKLVFKGHNWYLHAYCRERKAYRFFKLSRMDDLVSMPDMFDMKVPTETKDKNYEPYLSGEMMELEFTVEYSMAFRIYDEFQKASIKKEKDCLYVKASVPKNTWLIHYLLGFGDALTVVGPVDFRKEYMLTSQCLPTQCHLTY